MTNIYNQHRAAFANVSALVVMRGKERIATLAFKYPRDGASRLWCYVHFFGMPMVRGYASGYGYDKRTAAVESAIAKIDPEYFSESQWAKYRKECSRFCDAINKANNGIDWADSFRNAGYEALSAV